MRTRTLPSDFALKVFYTKHGVHHQFEVVACSGIAVEVDAAGGLEDAVQLTMPHLVPSL